MSPTSPFQRSSDDKRVAFLSELLAGANAREAAAWANLNRGSVYRWKLEDAEFAAVWAEIVAARPRRRNLHARVLRSVPGPKRHFESSHSATPDGTAGAAPEALWDKDFGPAREARR